MSIKSKFKKKSVLVTGHTGFKGSWLAFWLASLSARVTGIALEPPSKPSNFDILRLGESIEDIRIDIRDYDKIKDQVLRTQPDFVFHLAAQSLVRRSYIEPVETYQTNVLGTLNLMEGLRQLNKPCTVVLITSDKCYDNVEWIWGFREIDALGGPDPYSASKGATEMVIRSHIKSFFPMGGLIRIAIARAGNVIGGGDWANDRIVPDCIRSWSKRKKVILRNPSATRPWQHVLEPLSGYLKLASELNERTELHGEPFNFGPPYNQIHSVMELVKEMSKHWENVRWENDFNKETQPYESELLRLNCDKALHYLNWQANLSFQESVKMTTEWYRSYYENVPTIHDLTLSQIQDYESYERKKEMV